MVGDSLVNALTAVDGELYQVRLRSQLDAVTYPVKLNNRLANLKLSIETGDGRPTAAAVAGFESMSAALDAQLAALASVRSRIPAFNGLLAAQWLAPVTPP